jgi:FtsZ-binding cell division protein ZapB
VEFLKMNFIFLFIAIFLFHFAPRLSAQMNAPATTSGSTPAAPAMKVTSETAPIIEATRETLTKWVETKQLISKEKSEWASGKDILEDRVRLAQAETATVRDKLKEISAAVAEAQKKRDELAAQNDKLKATAEKSKSMVIAAEKKLRPLLPQLPEPLREKLKPIIARFPEDSEKSTASMAERLQNVLGILDQASAFNATVASVKELRTFPDGTRAEVTTVYLGLSQAYYTNREGTLAGIGHPGPDGWIWKPDNANGKKILLAVHILEGKEKGATFIDLPVKIQ